MTPEEKKWIDEASYEDMLRKWRFSPLGDTYFVDDQERADYFVKAMAEKRAQTNHVFASKRVGW
jgi:hypothetical protein